jgi:peptidoglycan/LPS O-acetylase OafA/YrhL
VRPEISQPAQAIKLFAIQYLRAAAAIGVVLAHGSTSLLGNGQALIPLEAGGKGVDLFFVISGFIMFYTTDTRPISAAEFYRRRIARVVPLYFILSTVGFLLAFALPHAFNTMTSQPLDYLRSILFVPFYNARTRNFHPEIGQGWTLNYEMFFYLVFGPCLALTRRWRIVPCLVLFCALSLAGAVLHPAGPLLSTYTDDRLLEFVLGMFVGYFLRQPIAPSWRTPAVWALASLACACVLLQIAAPAVTLPRLLATGLPATAIVAVALWLELRGRIPKLPWLLLLGDASYSLYLSHTFALALLRRLWLHSFDTGLIRTHVLYLLAACLLAIPASVLLYRWVELPASRAAAKLLHPQQTIRMADTSALPVRSAVPSP